MNKIVLISILLLTTLNTNAQSWQWAKGVTGHKAKDCSGLATDAAGNSYITGLVSRGLVKFGNITLVIPGVGSDTTSDYVAKYDSSGNIIWVETIRHVYADGDVVLDNKGNIYVSGQFLDSLDANGHTLTGGGIFIVKYDSAGSVQWAQKAASVKWFLGVPSDQVFFNMTTDKDDNIYATGSTMFDTTYFANNGPNLGMFTAKYNSAGNFIWQKNNRHALYINDQGTGIACDGAGNVYVAGAFTSSFAGDSMLMGNLVLKKRNIGYSILVAQYDSAGNVTWADNFGYGTETLSRGIAVDSKNNIYVTGQSIQDTLIFGTDTIINPGNSEWSAFVVKYNPAKEKVWERGPTKTGTNADAEFGVGSIVTDASDNIYITGVFSGTSPIGFGSTLLTNKDASGGSSNLFLAAYNPAGNAIWATSVGGASNQSGYYVSPCNITTDNSGNIYLAGNYSNFFSNIATVAFGNNILPTDSFQNNSIADLFIAKLGVIAAGIAPVAQPGNIAVYPNPSSHLINVVTDKMPGAQLTLFDVLGRNVYQSIVTGSNTTVNVGSLSGGMYFLQLQNGSSVYVTKIEVQR